MKHPRPTPEAIASANTKLEIATRLLAEAISDVAELQGRWLWDENITADRACHDWLSECRNSLAASVNAYSMAVAIIKKQASSVHSSHLP